MILGHFGGPGTHFGSPQVHFEDFGDYCDFGSVPATKKESLFEILLMTLTHVFSVEFVLFF